MVLRVKIGPEWQGLRTIHLKVAFHIDDKQEQHFAIMPGFEIRNIFSVEVLLKCLVCSYIKCQYNFVGTLLDIVTVKTIT